MNCNYFMVYIDLSKPTLTENFLKNSFLVSSRMKSVIQCMVFIV